jgi:hypothetical protein
LKGTNFQSVDEVKSKTADIEQGVSWWLVALLWTMEIRMHRCIDRGKSTLKWTEINLYDFGNNPDFHIIPVFL